MLILFKSMFMSQKKSYVTQGTGYGMLGWTWLFLCVSQFPMGPGPDGPMGGMGGMEPHHMNGSLGKL